MCNLYSMTKGQQAIRDLVRASRDSAGNLPPLPGIFPDMLAPVVRTAPDGEREVIRMRWGMPCPPKFGAQPVTNIRNTASAHWRRWLGPANRCLVLVTSFCEYEDPKAMPVNLTTPAEMDAWITAPWAEAAALQRPARNEVLRVVTRGMKQDLPITDVSSTAALF